MKYKIELYGGPIDGEYREINYPLMLLLYESQISKRIHKYRIEDIFAPKVVDGEANYETLYKYRYIGEV
jgi:hypothetical protein